MKYCILFPNSPITGGPLLCVTLKTHHMDSTWNSRGVFVGQVLISAGILLINRKIMNENQKLIRDREMAACKV